MHYFGISRVLLFHWYYRLDCTIDITFWLSISGNFGPKLHCGNVVDLSNFVLMETQLIIMLQWPGETDKEVSKSLNKNIFWFAFCIIFWCFHGYSQIISAVRELSNVVERMYSHLSAVLSITECTMAAIRAGKISIQSTSSKISIVNIVTSWPNSKANALSIELSNSQKQHV